MLKKKKKTTSKDSKETKITKKTKTTTKASGVNIEAAEKSKAKAVKEVKTVKSVKPKDAKAVDESKTNDKSKASTKNKSEKQKTRSEKATDTPTKTKTTVKDSSKKTNKKSEKAVKNTNPKLVAVGRRKTAVARVFMQKGTGVILINDKDLKVFSPNSFLNYKILQPLELIKGVKDFDISINVSGGGQAAQVEAIRLGISRCLLKFDVTYRAALKDLGYLTRDPRMVERKKFGHKKARRSFQFSKR